MNKSNRFQVLIGALLIVFGLAACVSAPETPTPTPAPSPTPQSLRGAGGVLNLLYWQAPTVLNPHLTTGTKDLAACRVTYEPLASYDKDGALIPFLAAEIPSLDNDGVAPDGKSVTWRLREGLFWSDGEPFTADDVLFTYEFIIDPANNAQTGSTYEAIDRVEVIDDLTVTIHFRDVNPAWSLPFVGSSGMILPRHAFEQDAEAANALPIGTGPYRMVPPGIKPQEVLLLGTQLVETNKIVYEPNPYFREPDQPYFSKVVLRGGGTVQEAARALFNGEVDFAYNMLLSDTLIDELEALGKGKTVSYTTAKVERILINLTDPNKTTPDGERSSVQHPHPFFSDLRVRQAFNAAIDRERIAALYGRTGSPAANVLVSPATYDSPNTVYEFSPDRAKALLDEAGWIDTDGDGVRDKDGVKMRVLFQTSVNSIRQQTQKIVKENLEAIGVEVELKILDASIFFGANPDNPNSRWHFYADLEEYNIGNSSPDPGAYMQGWVCAEIAQKSNNWTGNNIERWCSSEYDALYEQSKTEMDPEKRRLLFIQMNDLLVNQVVSIPLVDRAGVHGFSNALIGVDLTPWDSELWNIKDWRRAQ
ncbi:MAG: peptide ABC transporter substrate-binding protein [Anaerolineae bacterium]|nr:peptide ABC transporter substrate-binding protein [Anaerolineae bacterium]